MNAFMTRLGGMSLQAAFIICIVFLFRWLFVKFRIEKKYTCW